MRLATLLLAFALALPASAPAKAQPTPAIRAETPTETPTETPDQRDARMAWWRNARFGMFIHWGLYAIPAGQWGQDTHHAEWIRTTAQIPLETYDDLVHQFNPVNFDAAAWARMAREAGMKYIVITTKHHDGFCLWDSAETEFDVMSTPFKRDIIRELCDAARAEGLQIGFYHSIMDWHHPDYLPRRQWETTRSTEGADFDRFEDYLHAQVTELLTNYGPIGVMWFDGEWEETWSEDRGRELYALCRRLQPDIIVNNRVGTGREGMAGLTREGAFGGDFGTPEQEVPHTGLPGVDWESCMTMNDHWGYNAFDTRWKSSTELIRTLVDIVSKGGNYLLNVGPRADGTFPPEAVDRLREIGEWMETNRYAIHHTTASPFGKLQWGRSTHIPPSEDEATWLALMVFDWPSDGRLAINGLASDPVDGRLLRPMPANRRLPGIRTGDFGFKREGANLVVTGLPPSPLDPHCSVVVLAFDHGVDAYTSPTISAPTPQFIDTLRLTLSHPRSGYDEQGNDLLQLRYTLDATDPTAASPAYDGPLVLDASTTVRVQAWRDTTPLSPIAERRFEKVTPLAAATPAAPLHGQLNCTHYQGTWDRLPRFDTLTPTRTDQPAGLTLDTRSRDEHIAQVFTGYLYVKADAVYQFALSSDDGSRFFLHDQLVIDNDGLHATSEAAGTIALAAGYHPVRIEYFNRSGGFSLSLRGEQIGLPMVVIPARAFAIDGPATPASP